MLLYIEAVGLVNKLQAVLLAALEKNHISVTVIEAHILASLHVDDGQRASELAQIVRRPATSFTPILDKLETRGLIERKPHPDDRRSIRIHLTPKGREVGEKANRVLESIAVPFRNEITAWGEQFIGTHVT